jgi:histidinol phosphatase-like PHP family hydrolase
LRSSFGVKVSANSLKSILAPDELKALLKKFTPDDYSFGKPANENTPLNEIFENVINGKYRVNLHLHTNNSDGKMTAEEFLAQSVKYADKVAEKINDNKPPYTSAITDHNNIEGVKKVIALIAQTPEKYKNFRFAAGCEFMFFDDEHGLKKPTYEAVGLGFNPFDEELNESLSDKNSTELISKIKDSGGVVSYAHPLRFCQGQEMSEDFIKYLLSTGINGIETNYQYLFRNMEQVLKQKDKIYEIAKKNNWFETGGTDTHAKNIFHPKAEPVLDIIW